MSKSIDIFFNGCVPGSERQAARTYLLLSPRSVMLSLRSILITPQQIVRRREDAS